jgi:predicted small secreted protein
VRRIVTIASLVLASSLAAACGTASGAKSGKSMLACGHWNNIKGDIRSGILTDAEIRSKVSEVRESATSPAVESAATTLLAGITSNSKSKITAGAEALDSACQ